MSVEDLWGTGQMFLKQLFLGAIHEAMGDAFKEKECVLFHGAFQTAPLLFKCLCDI